MFDIIAKYLGYIIITTLGLLLIVCLMWFTYTAYDYWLKKLLGWKERNLREDLFYFIKHKEEIREYIKDQQKRR